MTANQQSELDSRFSGHESFCCRYGWLPKFAHGITTNPHLFENEEEAMLELGIGRNMVRSIRFWAEAFGMSKTSSEGGLELTALGREIFHPTSGTDPFLESLSSLWILHWQIATKGRLGAWTVGFSDISEREVERDRFEALVASCAEAANKRISPSTIHQHCDIFIKTYSAPSSNSFGPGGIEETLSAPFQELGLFRLNSRSGRPYIGFEKGPKPGLDVRSFGLATYEFWRRTSRTSKTLPLLSILTERLSPGRVFCLSLLAVTDLASQLASRLPNLLIFEEDTVRSGLILKDGNTLSEFGNLVRAL